MNPNRLWIPTVFRYLGFSPNTFNSWSKRPLLFMKDWSPNRPRTTLKPYFIDVQSGLKLFWLGSQFMFWLLVTYSAFIFLIFLFILIRLLKIIILICFCDIFCFSGDLQGKVSIVAKPGVKLEIPDGAEIVNKVLTYLWILFISTMFSW